MKTLVAYPVKMNLSDVEGVVYAPDLAKPFITEGTISEQDLSQYLKEVKPDCLVVGNNLIDRNIISYWKNLMPESELCIIRRGTSLSRIDLEAAEELGVNVYNTPGVNSPFVANYVLNKLGIANAKPGQKLAVIGSGNIGARVAKAAAEQGLQVTVYSPSLVSSDNRPTIAAKKGLVHPLIKFADSAYEATAGANYVAVAVDAEKITKSADQIHVSSIFNLAEKARLVSISEISVFSQEALLAIVNACENKEISAVLDSNPSDIKKLDKYSSINQLELASNAMKGAGCAEAMDQAALTILGEQWLKKLVAKSFEFTLSQPPHRRNQAITIVGAGIDGLLNAFVLAQSGYHVVVADSHEKPAEPSKKYNGSATLDGFDARHASYTETLPHAIPARAEVMYKTPLDHGWKVIEEPNAIEQAWIENFAEVAASPELQAVFSKFVGSLNRNGVALWNKLFAKFPELGESVNTKSKVVRLYKNEAALKAGLQVQQLHAAGEDLRVLNSSEIAVALPGVDTTQFAGGIEVNGFTINIHKLTGKLIEFLDKQGVEFKWASRVSKVKENVVTFENGETLHSERVVMSTGVYGNEALQNSAINKQVQGVAGFWLELLNTDGLQQGFKIHEDEPLGVINVTLSDNKEKILVSGGFGFVGKRDVRDFSSQQLDDLSQLIVNAAQKYMPQAYDASIVKGPLETRICVRPMTGDGMPIIGKLCSDTNTLFAGGTNAGGFVQAPVISTILAGLVESNQQFSAVAKILSSDRNSIKLSA